MKERLLGAAVLVLLAVLIIPVLLDGPQPSGEVSRNLELPAPQSPAGRTHVIEVQPGEAPVQPAAAATSPAPAAEQSPSAPPPADESPTAPADSIAPAATATSPADAVQDEIQGWAVQVGSFSSETNARRLAGLLQASDYRAFVVRNVVDGRVMYRVRVGPEPDRERAAVLAERLEADRQQTQLVRHP